VAVGRDEIIENGNVTYIRDGEGHSKGRHIKSADEIFDEQGHYDGPGDQLLRILDEE
jgi:hypothetical protein